MNSPYAYLLPLGFILNGIGLVLFLMTKYRKIAATVFVAGVIYNGLLLWVLIEAANSMLDR